MDTSSLKLKLAVFSCKLVFDPFTVHEQGHRYTKHRHICTNYCLSLDQNIYIN